MENLTPTLNRLIKEFSKFTGIGPKSAERLAFQVLELDENDAKNLADAISTVRKKTRYCKICHNITEDEICGICADSKRDAALLCVVEHFKDVGVIEKIMDYKGLYHVLNGHISPLEGKNPEDLNIKSLIERLKTSDIKEIIFATNPNVEGDATALYIADLLKNTKIKMTRIARGIPIGGDLEYADPQTLSRSIMKREEL